MQTAEQLRVLLFVSLVATVYVLAASALVRLILRRIKRLPAPSARQIWFRRAIFSLALLGIFCIAYGYYVEPYWLAVTQVRIESAKLAKGARLRIAHISDLHCDPEPRLEERLPQVIADLKPDLIVFTGDSLNSPDGLPILKRCLSRLATIAPTFVVKGNWDVYSWQDIDLFSGTGVKELNGEAVKVEVGATPVWIAGAPFAGQERIDRTLAAAPPEALTIFLYHSPDEAPEIARRKVDLYCAGHTHGGQVALPFYGALITFSKFGKQYEAGLYRVSDTWMYVNRGIGMEGGEAPRVRFCARPEVTVIEVAPAQ